MPYTYAPLLQKLLPSVEETRKAMILANDTKSPDPRALLSILSRLPQADLKLMGHMQTRKLAVQGFPWKVEPSDPENAKAVEVARAVKTRLVSARLHHKFGILIGAVFYGVAGLRAEWSLAGKEYVAKVTPISSLSLMTAGGIPVAIAETARMKTDEIKPREQYIITSYNPFEETMPDYAGGILRTAMWLVLIKQFNWNDWARFNEVFAMPTRWASYPEGSSEQDKAAALKAAEAVGSEMYAAVPERVKLQFIEAVKTGTVSAYKDLLAAVDEALAILILGQTLTSQIGDSGSFAAAKVHDQVRSDYMWHDLQMVEQAVNEQYIAQDFRLNHGDKIELRPSFEFVTDETPDFEKNARIISEVKPTGILLKKSEVYEKIGFTAPEEGDEVL